MTSDVESSPSSSSSAKATLPVTKTLAVAKVEKWKRSPLPGPYNSVAISADGSKVVGGTFFYNDGSTLPTQTVGFFGWDSTGANLWPGKWPAGDTFAVTATPFRRAGILSVSISRDGSWAASGGLISPGVGFIDVYDAAGNKTTLLNPTETVRSVELSSDGSYLVAGADKLYVFKRTGNTWSAPATLSDPVGVVQRVGISGDGQWIATAINDGWTSLVRNQLGSGGGIAKVGAWQIPLTPPDPQPYIQEVAVAANGSAYAAAGADGKAYYFDIAATTPGALTPRWGFDPPGQSACKWVAITDDGAHVSAVFSFGGGPGIATKGRVYLLKDIKNPGPGYPVQRVWTGNEKTAHGPNAVSMGTTAASHYHVAAADGIPDPSKPDGGFYLFDGGTGDALWGTPPDHNYPTSLMNYTVAISADGSAVAGGSNDGYVYYFVVP